MATKWDASAVVWKAKLKGEGQSSVVNWGDKIFVTSATDKGAKRWVHCLDRKTGKLLWEREVASAKQEQIHKMNTWATPTCVTDGERVIAFFGQVSSQVLHRMQISGSIRCCRMTAVSAMSMAIS